MVEDKNVKRAVAIGYKPNDEAPKVLASGKGTTAERMLEIAKENGIPTHTDPNLVHLLNFVEIGKYIPESLYEIVAKVLTFVADIDKIMMKSDKQ